MNKYVIGLDYGTDSVRAVMIDTASGDEVDAEVFEYPRWKKQLYCDAANNRFRQHPLDHIEGLEYTVKTVITHSKVDPETIKGICIDTTGSSPVPVSKDGMPLALKQGYDQNPNAMVVLWKDHTAITEANEINSLARTWAGADFTRFSGGIYSSEWFWAKILHVIREDDAVKETAHTWMEHCDLMTFLLTGSKDLTTFKRSRCAAGHKAMWHKSWDGLPAKEFLEKLDPYLASLRDNLYSKTYTTDEIAGTLSKEWAEKLGLTEKTIVTVGTLDAHAGAVGAKIEEHALVRVMGTSTCDIIVTPHEVLAKKTVWGICGQVDGSVIPGMIGLEAGQSAFGDLLAWFKDLLSWPIDNLVMSSELLSHKQKEELQQEITSSFIRKLSDAAKALPMEEAVPTALDWINGRRTPDADQELESALSHLNLGTRAPHIFKSLVHAICFGSKKIVERFEEEGVNIQTVIGIGGVARKSPFIMQTLANVLNMPIKVAASDQAPALGAAIYAAVAVGVYPDVITAAQKMGSDFEAEYHPQEQAVSAYAKWIKDYEALGRFAESNK